MSHPSSEPTPAHRPNPVLPVVALVLAVLLAACGGVAGQPAGAGGDGGDAGPSAAPAGGAAATPEGDAIDHPTGATDIVLRVSEEGGFMMLEYVMSRVPAFTLYGDGRVIIATTDQAKAAPGGVPQTVLREGRLTEDQVQAILRNALVEGMVGVAKEEFPVMVMDVPTTVIELDAGGVSKRVKVAGLGMEGQPGPDAQVLAALAQLVERLKTIPVSGAYAAPASVAVLAETELAPGTSGDAWPWPDLAPAAFDQPPVDDEFGFRTHVLTADEADAVGLSPGGAAEPRTYAGPDGKTYIVVVRPALPEEAAAAG